MDTIQLTCKFAFRIVVTIASAMVLIVGIVMVFALEFPWPRAWFKRIREGISDGGSSSRSERDEDISDI